MNLRSVDLNLLTVFDAVMTERNVSRAAEKIGMSQPAMSAALARLRLVLKDDLYVRTGRGVKPTPRALELEKPIRRILDMIGNTLSQSLGFDYKTSNRVFTIGSMDYGCILLIPALMKHLREIDSSVTINLWPQYDEQVRDQMHFGSIDFTVDCMPILDEEIHNQLILEEPAYCLVDKNHPVIRDQLTLEDYLRAKQVVLFPQGKRISSLDEHLMSLDMRRQRHMKVPSLFNYPYVIANSDMICTLPQRIARHFAKLYGFNLFPAPVPDWAAHYYLMWHTGLEDDPAHLWLRENIISLCKSM